MSRKLTRRESHILVIVEALLLIIIGSLYIMSYSSHESGPLFGSSGPEVIDHNLMIQEIVNGLHFPTRIAFLAPSDILVIEKNNGIVIRIKNGTILDDPLLDVNVASQEERGLVGIAALKGTEGVYVFLYYTEAESKDGGKALGNRLYKYEFKNDKLINPELLLDLPAAQGPFHNGGAVTIGPDGHVYVSVGDVSACKFTHAISSCQTVDTKAQNYERGQEPDGRAGILRITQDGKAVGNGILGKEYPLNLYYAYGIRNSFGLDFDPVTGNLWDTENGPDYGDEINIVQPGFNSGWEKTQGIWKTNGSSPGEVSLTPSHLENFGGIGKYHLPEFTWRIPVGPTAIAFINSDKLGKQYKNDILVGAVHGGSIYHLDLNVKRDGFDLKGRLADKIADDVEESRDIIFGQDFGQVTDIKIGPDGYVYVVIFSQESGKILKIVPKNETSQ